MSQTVRKSLETAVLEASQADSWEEATREWSEVSLIFNGVSKSNCVCGNAIKYAYELFNQVTGRRLFPIGSDCVRHFRNLDLDERLEQEEKALKKLDHLTKKVHRKEPIKVNKNDFDESLLDWLWRKGAFKADRGNQFQPQKDYDLFLEVFHGGMWSKAEPSKRARMEAVLDQFIKPFLLGRFDEEVYLVKLGQEKVEYEQDLRQKAARERQKRQEIQKNYQQTMKLALGPAEKAYQTYFDWYQDLTDEERKWEEILYGSNQTECLLKTKQVQKEIQKGKRIEEQTFEERKQKQVWLVNSSFREIPEDKARLARLAVHYRKTGEIPLEEQFFSENLLEFFYKMKVFEFEIHPEKVVAFLKSKLTSPASHMETIWVQEVLKSSVQPFLDRYLL